MRKRNNLFFGTKPYEIALIVKNQELAQKIGSKLITYKTVFDNGSSKTDWIGIAKSLGYPSDRIYNITNGRLNKEFNHIIKALQELAISGEHGHPIYNEYYLHNKSIITQN